MGRVGAGKEKVRASLPEGKTSPKDYSRKGVRARTRRAPLVHRDDSP
jgi:hypothetical protein